MIFGAFERLVAMRYLRARRQEGFISVIAVFSLLGIALGVATLIVVVAVMNGFRQELLSRILGVNGALTVYAVGPMAEDYRDLVARIAKTEGVISVTPRVEGLLMAAAGDQTAGVRILGVAPADLLRRKIISDNILSGSLSAFEAGEGVLLGIRLAETLGLEPGDTVTLINPNGTQTAMGTFPRLKDYPVAALFGVGMYDFDSSTLYLPLARAQTFFRLPPDRVNAIEILVDRPERAGPLRRDLETLLGPNYQIVDWQTANAGFFELVTVQRNVIALILSLIVIIAALNIVSGQIMLVKDKGRDIAVLRTLGAGRGSVMRIFLLTGASIGILGTVLGTALGALFADNIEGIRQWLQGLTGAELFSPEIYFLSELPVELSPWVMAGIAGGALALSFSAALYPSWRAARLDPVEALRYE